MGINQIKKYLAGKWNCLSLPPDLKITVAAITAEAVETVAATAAGSA
jgi:hypothetical protein